MAIVAQVSGVGLLCVIYSVLMIIYTVLTFFVDDKARRNCSEVDCLLTYLCLYLIKQLSFITVHVH